ncbi:MAG: hypothetical protein OSA37_04635 [Flavobacteriales bacterium]|nr:hypothetical protein [Flavobacteriales bacterium]
MKNLVGIICCFVAFSMSAQVDRALIGSKAHATLNVFELESIILELQNKVAALEAQAAAETYTAGFGIDISTGVISSTATEPEYLFVQPNAIESGYVSFNPPITVNGVSYNSVTNEFTLKAGKTYELEGAVYMHTTTSSISYSFVFYDKTNNASIGSEAYQRTVNSTGTTINQPTMNAIISPSTDIQVGIKDIYGATGGFISSRGFFKVVELK